MKQSVRAQKNIASQRRVRCGQCDGCKRKDCGSCVQCLDKKKFSGQGKKKQCCIHRKCTHLTSGVSCSTTMIELKSKSELSELPGQGCKVSREDIVDVSVSYNYYAMYISYYTNRECANPILDL